VFISISKGRAKREFNERKKVGGLNGGKKREWITVCSSMGLLEFGGLNSFLGLD